MAQIHDVWTGCRLLDVSFNRECLANRSGSFAPEMCVACITSNNKRNCLFTTMFVVMNINMQLAMVHVLVSVLVSCTVTRSVCYTSIL